MNELVNLDQRVNQTTALDIIHRRVNPADVYLARLSAGSRPTVRSTINYVAKLLRTDPALIAWGSFRYEHTQAIRATLAEGHPDTANKKIFHVRGILREAMLLGQMSSDDFLRASGIKSIRGSRKRAGRALTRDELVALFESQDVSTAAGARNSCILALGVGCGVRVSEMRVTVERVDLDAGSIRIMGKGNKERDVPIPEGTQRAIRRWLEYRGVKRGSLLAEVDRHGSVCVHPLSRKCIQKILDKMAWDAGVRRITTHDMRRTYITNFLDDGVDIKTVSELVGHSQIQTTANYDRRSEQRLFEVVKTLDIPFYE